jgi:hypothetical protein
MNARSTLHPPPARISTNPRKWLVFAIAFLGEIVYNSSRIGLYAESPSLPKPAWHSRHRLCWEASRCRLPITLSRGVGRHWEALPFPGVRRPSKAVAGRGKSTALEGRRTGDTDVRTRERKSSRRASGAHLTGRRGTLTRQRGYINPLDGVILNHYIPTCYEDLGARRVHRVRCEGGYPVCDPSA